MESRIEPVNRVDTEDPRLQKVVKLLEHYLSEQSKDENELSVVAQPESVSLYDNDDYRYIKLYIILDGRRDDLMSHWEPSLVGKVRRWLEEVEIHDFPVLSYVTKAAWDKERGRATSRV